MINHNNNVMETPSVLSNTSIAQFYANKNILVTGATGFMGKVLVECLIRKCSEINCIYILVRMKNGVDPLERYQNYVQDIIFDRIRQESPERLQKIKLIKGDIIEENMDISEKDELELIENVHIIFHCAARAKFSLTLRDALINNTHATLRILQLAERMRHLKVFSHFSTVYCNPTVKVMEEKHYAPCEDPYKVIELLTSPRQADLDEAEPRLTDGFPNTYSFSKLLAEELVYKFRNKIKSVITRPGVVISAWKDPYPGYVENRKNGFIGPMMARASGAMRTIFADPKKLIAGAPVDVVTHAILALTCKKALQDHNEVLYCNIIDTDTHPWTIQRYYDFELQMTKKYPMRNQLWWPYCPVTKNYFYFQFRRICYHYAPAYYGDMWTRIFRRKPQLVFFQRKFDRGLKTVSFYTRRDFIYKNDQFMALPNELSEKNRDTFYCDFARLDMEDVFRNYVLGVRKYILKLNDDESLEFRRGLITLYWYVDLISRLALYIIMFIIGFFVLFFIFDRDTLLNMIKNAFNTCKFLLSNKILLDDELIQKCKRD